MKGGGGVTKEEKWDRFDGAHNQGGTSRCAPTKRKAKKGGERRAKNLRAKAKQSGWGDTANRTEMSERGTFGIRRWA